LILSIDIDVGSAEVGEKNGGSNDRNVHNYLTESTVGRIEEEACPIFLQLFDELEWPITFALRGQLTEMETSIIDLMLGSNIKHDIGAHGYYHKAFTALSKFEAEKELKLISNGMRKFGIKPKSFVFPRNKISHLQLLEKWGYLCFRGYGDFLRDGMYIKKYGNLYDIHPSLYLGECYEPSFAKKIINIAVRYRRPFHIWFHLWNFGDNLDKVKRRMTRVLVPITKYAKDKQKLGTLQFETMRSMSEKYGNK
jgi:peptidoglycan/xylan/chitin deacetylase (PgdA/CDA1 family)